MFIQLTDKEKNLLYGIISEISELVSNRDSFGEATPKFEFNLTDEIDLRSLEKKLRLTPCKT